MTLLIGLQGICPKNVKHILLSDTMLQLNATSFASFSSLYQLQYPPSFSESCESPIGRSSQIFRMIPFKEPKISSNNTSKIIEFRQITRVLGIFLLPKTIGVDKFNWIGLSVLDRFPVLRKLDLFNTASQGSKSAGSTPISSPVFSHFKPKSQ